MTTETYKDLGSLPLEEEEPLPAGVLEIWLECEREFFQEQKQEADKEIQAWQNLK